MMTSFVKYHGHGFWCRNEVLREWLREVILVANAWPNPPDWFAKACGYWDAIVCGLKSYRTDLRLDVDITSPQRQRECEQLFEVVAKRRLHPTVRRAALLALSLIRGELAGTVPTVLDYWSDEEWLLMES
jgi:hypothetical protein